MKFRSDQFNQIWAVDFEFISRAGEKPIPVCLVALDLISRKKLRIWQDELREMVAPPYSVGPDSLFISFYASAELGCHRALSWPLPVNVLDLFTEFRNHTNGLALPCGRGLIGALVYFGIDNMGALRKDEMRDLILRGGPWSRDERKAILDYCELDVKALPLLLEKLAPTLDLPRGLLRGRYMKAAACIESIGIPIDANYLRQLRERWDGIKETLISQIDKDYGVYDGRSFRMEKFENWLIANDIPWPRTELGNLSLQDDTFREMARSHPKVAPLRELRTALSQMRLSELAVGQDGRNRCLLSAFQARTGRNTPSNSKFIFGPSVWLRGLIKPGSGRGLAYVDWSQQEFGIAAALSGDCLMMDAYRSGDPYLGFAKQAGSVPPNATKETHSLDRERFKACVLGVNYGMGEQSLALRINQPTAAARGLLRLHRETYKQFWKWSDGALDHAMFYGYLSTVFGWAIHIPERPNPRMLRNFLVQGNGAEMMRLACCLAVERGVKVCAPIHDALLIEAPLEELDGAIATTQVAMLEAGKVILDGFELRTDVKIITYPDRYMDERGVNMWDTVMNILKSLEAKQSWPGVSN